MLFMVIRLAEDANTLLWWPQVVPIMSKHSAGRNTDEVSSSRTVVSYRVISYVLRIVCLGAKFETWTSPHEHENFLDSNPSLWQGNKVRVSQVSNPIRKSSVACCILLSYLLRSFKQHHYFLNSSCPCRFQPDACQGSRTIEWYSLSKRPTTLNENQWMSRSISERSLLTSKAATARLIYSPALRPEEAEDRT